MSPETTEMVAPKVFFVHLRRPNRANPNERRDDPFYEFGSFGCTRCHSNNLFNPRHAEELEGSRLAFVQGGQLGSRLVFLTPPITVTKWKSCCEARWKPAKPFKYTEAPILAWNEGESDFSLIEQFARDTECPTVESGLSSRLRSNVQPLPPKLARQIIRVYERKRSNARRSAIAETYNEALPYDPPLIDDNRKKTYESHVRGLNRDNQPHCGSTFRLRSNRRKKC